MPPLGTRSYESGPRRLSELEQKRVNLAWRMHEIMKKVFDEEQPNRRKRIFRRRFDYASPRVYYPAGEGSEDFICAWLTRNTVTDPINLVTQRVRYNELGDIDNPYEPVEEPILQAYSSDSFRVIMDPYTGDPSIGFAYEGELAKVDDAIETVELIAEKVSHEAQSNG